MGNKRAAQARKQKKQDTKRASYPFVSICTPTYNRRPFFPAMFRCFLNQTYPKSRMEWIIVDDGTDSVEDLVKSSGIPQIKYFRCEKKMSLGKKRNYMHEKTCGEILVYMDDDDYYTPRRVEHSVETLLKNPQALCAGSSRIHIYFKHLQKIIEFGPYSQNHGTAGTFAFRRKLLHETRYDETACLAEEKAFLKNYTIPFVQMDPLQTILVFSHEQNTFDKRTLLENMNPAVVRDAPHTVDDFVKEADQKEFYMEQIDTLLKCYAPGDPKMKPDVIKQTKEISEKRKKMQDQEKEKLMNQASLISITGPDGNQKQLSNKELVELIEKNTKQLGEQNVKITTLTKELKSKEDAIANLEAKVNSQKKLIEGLMAKNITPKYNTKI